MKPTTDLEAESCADCGKTLGDDEGDGLTVCSGCLALRAHGWTCSRCGRQNFDEGCPCRFEVVP